MLTPPEAGGERGVRFWARRRRRGSGAAASEFLLRALAFDEDDDAAFVRVLAVDHLVPDGHTDDVGPGEDRVLVGHLGGPDIEGHRQPLRSSALITSKPSPRWPP